MQSEIVWNKSVSTPSYAHILSLNLCFRSRSSEENGPPKSYQNTSSFSVGATWILGKQVQGKTQSDVRFNRKHNPAVIIIILLHVVNVQYVNRVKGSRYNALKWAESYNNKMNCLIRLPILCIVVVNPFLPPL